MAVANAPEDVIGTFSSSLLTEAIVAPERVKVDFRSFAFIGNVSEDIRVCYTRGAIGVRSFRELLAREQVVFGATAPGTSGNVDIGMLRNLFGVRLKQVQGYAGSADKRLALEKGEIDGDCGGFTSLPEDWLHQRKIDVLLRLSPTLVAGLDRDVPFGGDLLGNDHDRKIYDFLIAPERLGRLFMVPAKVAPDRVAAAARGFRHHGRGSGLSRRGTAIRTYGGADDRHRGRSPDRAALCHAGRRFGPCARRGGGVTHGSTC
jgi:hypothetical protein